MLAAFEAEGLDTDWGHSTTPARLDLGRMYCTDEVAVGASRDLTRALVTTAPSAAFVLWQDPVYEIPGDYIAHVPGVGTLDAECNAAGEPIVALKEVIPFFNTACGSARTQTEDNMGGQIRQHAQVIAALDALIRFRPPVPAP